MNIFYKTHKKYKLKKSRILEPLEYVKAVPELKEAVKMKPFRKSYPLGKPPLPPVDEYEEDFLNGGIDDHTIGKMTSRQIQSDRTLKKNYVNFIKNKISDFTSTSQFLNFEEDDAIFIKNYTSYIGLDEFVTSVDYEGIDLVTLMNTSNIDKSLRDLLSHVKNKHSYKMTYELIDKKVIKQLNEFDNANVKSFHKDIFMKFKDFKNKIFLEKFKRQSKNDKKNLKFKGFSVS